MKEKRSHRQRSLVEESPAKRRKNWLKIAWRCVKFQTFFAYRHRRLHYYLIRKLYLHFLRRKTEKFLTFLSHATQNFHHQNFLKWVFRPGKISPKKLQDGNMTYRVIKWHKISCFDPGGGVIRMSQGNFLTTTFLMYV